MSQRNRPAVSAVMPVYNVERYVGEAVQSVLAQSFADFELLIVDDGGSDGSMAICRSFDDPRIRIVSQANRGLAGARNTGILAARGNLSRCLIPMIAGCLKSWRCTPSTCAPTPMWGSATALALYRRGGAAHAAETGPTPCGREAQPYFLPQPGGQWLGRGYPPQRAGNHRFCPSREPGGAAISMKACARAKTSTAGCGWR
jgi:hypothetical protein